MTDRFPHPYTLDEGIEFVKFCKKHQPAHVLAIEVEGEFVGAVGVHPQEDVYHKNAELGYWVAKHL